MKKLILIALVGLLIASTSGCAGYDHYKIEKEQERQILDQREGARRVAAEMPEHERNVQAEIAANFKVRQEAAQAAATYQIENADIPDTAGVNNRHGMIWNALNGYIWWKGSDELKKLLN